MSQSQRKHETRQTKAKDADKRVDQTSMATEEQPMPAWAQDILKAVNDTKDDLKSSIKELKEDTRAILERMSDAERRIGALEDTHESHDKSIQTLTKVVNDMKNKLTNLEAHSRRNNVIFRGLDEGVLESSNPGKVLEEILRYILDLGDTDPIPEVERHHRSLRPRPGPTDPPRPYIVRLLRWSDRQRILECGRNKQSLSWRGKPFYIHQDFPAVIHQKRAEYNEITRKLRGTKIRYGLLYPSKLIVTVQGEKRIYNTPEEARRDLAVHIPNVFG